MKTYVLTVSRTFPETHKRAGEETYFSERILAGQKIFGACDDCTHKDCGHCEYWLNPKLHTIRANYVLWANRIKEIQEGKAILSIRYWSGNPYNSKQVEICQLDKDSGVGIQELCLKPKSILEDSVELFYIDNNFYNPLNLGFLSRNDGLSYEDFKEWFKSYDLSHPMAIIHFTSFRY